MPVKRDFERQPWPTAVVDPGFANGGRPGGKICFDFRSKNVDF